MSECFRWAEDGGGYIVRLYEAGRSTAQAEITFASNVKSVSECSLLEENRQPVVLTNGKASLTFRPFEIKTLLLRH